jgi:hypothetical protein
VIILRIQDLLVCRWLGRVQRLQDVVQQESLGHSPLAVEELYVWVRARHPFELVCVPVVIWAAVSTNWGPVSTAFERGMCGSTYSAEW